MTELHRCRVNEHSSFRIQFTITDDDNAAVPLADITEATLTLYDIDTSDKTISPSQLHILNSRDEQDVKNTNDVTIDPTSGLLTWAVQPEDNEIVTSRRQVERHKAEFHISFMAGSFWYELEIEVKNMGRPTR